MHAANCGIELASACASRDHYGNRKFAHTNFGDRFEFKDAKAAPHVLEFVEFAKGHLRFGGPSKSEGGAQIGAPSASSECDRTHRNVELWALQRDPVGSVWLRGTGGSVSASCHYGSIRLDAPTSFSTRTASDPTPLPHGA